MKLGLKISASVFLLVAYTFASFVIGVAPVSGRLRLTLRIRNTSFFSGIALKILGIRVHLKHAERLRRLRGRHLVVSNHLSYVDVLVISSLLPSIFITSVELGQTFLLGTLARFGGSLFVERRTPSGLKREIGMISKVLAGGTSIVLFPEGTTSNGDRVRPFKNALFDAAITARSSILPLCLRYTKIDGADVTSGNGEAVFYFGDATFFGHLSRLLELASVDVNVLPLKRMRPRRGASRKDLAAETYEVISSAYDDRNEI